MQNVIQVTATTPGSKPLNIQESIESGEDLNHSLIELEATVEGFIYTSRADFHPAQSKLLMYRQNPDKTIEPVEFPKCHNLRDAVGIMSEMFCLLQECVEAQDIDKAAALLAFNLDKTFLANLDRRLG
jgi:hypothetical protein